MSIALLLAALLLAQPPVSPHERFFVGRTQGEGTVRMILSGSHAVSDETNGRIDREGTLVLDQVVREEGKPARRRTWRIRRSGTNRITGTITGARGPVTGEVTGNVLHLRYRSVEGPSVEQWITLRADGRSAHNRMVFRRFGVTVATVEETIRRAE